MQLIDYHNYNWQQAIDARLLQTSNMWLCERALQDNVAYETLINLWVSKEQSVIGAQSWKEQAVQLKVEEEVRRLRQEYKKLKSQSQSQSK